MAEESEYQPVDCGFHDELESLATMRLPAEVVDLDEDGREIRVERRIRDVFTRGKARGL